MTKTPSKWSLAIDDSIGFIMFSVYEKFTLLFSSIMNSFGATTIIWNLLVSFPGGRFFFSISFFLKFFRALNFLLAWLMSLGHLSNHYWECLSNYSCIDQTIFVTGLNLMNNHNIIFNRSKSVCSSPTRFFLFPSCFVVKSMKIFLSLHGGSGTPAELWQLHISPAFRDRFLYRSKWVTSDKGAFFTDNFDSNAELNCSFEVKVITEKSDMSQLPAPV